MMALISVLTSNRSVFLWQLEPW